MVSQNKDRASSESTAGELVGNTRVDTSPADIAREETVFKSEFFSVDLESERRYTLYGIIMIKKKTEPRKNSRQLPNFAKTIS